jgi:hypothetical protein
MPRTRGLGTAARQRQQCLPQAKLPYASGTYNTREASTRSPYVQYGESGTRVSAQTRA